jgi:hypothetical protein
VVGQAEGVISGGSGDDAPLLLLVVEHDQRVASAALLEASGVLNIGVGHYMDIVNRVTR